MKRSTITREKLKPWLETKPLWIIWLYSKPFLVLMLPLIIFIPLFTPKTLIGILADWWDSVTARIVVEEMKTSEEIGKTK